MRIRFTIPGKPVPLARARAVRMKNGGLRMFTPEDSVKYQEKTRRVAVYAGCPVFRPGCSVKLAIFLPDRRVRDRDNIVKNVFDALQANKRLNRRAVAWKNDHDIGPFAVAWTVDRERPRVEVTIEGDV
jgi:Holliday junction resolvase RusA-like endonuclease